jgi:predicted nuclease with TOPRIM domain
VPRPGSKKRYSVNFEARSEEEKQEWTKLADEANISLNKWLGVQVRKTLGEADDSPELAESRRTVDELSEKLHESQAKNQTLERSHATVDAELLRVRARLYGGDSNSVSTDLAQFFKSTISREGEITRKELLHRIDDAFDHPELLDEILQLERTFSSIGMLDVTSQGVLRWMED